MGCELTAVEECPGEGRQGIVVEAGWGCNKVAQNIVLTRGTPQIPVNSAGIGRINYCADTFCRNLGILEVDITVRFFMTQVVGLGDGGSDMDTSSVLRLKLMSLDPMLMLLN